MHLLQSNVDLNIKPLQLKEGTKLVREVASCVYSTPWRRYKIIGYYQTTLLW
jgi:hypothetical protein